MAARGPTRSQSGAKAEARRRVAEKMAAAEEVLGDYITAGEDAARLRAEVGQAEIRQADALARLAGLVGRAMAADMAGVDEAKVRSALARKPTRQALAAAAPTAADGAGESSSSTGADQEHTLTGQPDEAPDPQPTPATAWT
jgi:topoisomerase IA-like protein